MKRRALFTGMTAIFAVLLMAGPVLADLTAVSGGAYGESVDVFTAAVVPVHVTSGPIPSVTLATNASNSPQNATGVNTCVGATCSILSTGTLTVHTDGTINIHPSSVNSTANVLTVNALAGLVTADVVASQCAVSDSGGTSGSSTFTNASVATTPTPTAVAVNPGPNTVIAVSTVAVIGTVTLNEQTYDLATNTLIVNAIHIRITGGTLLGSGDIIIAQSHCDSSPTGPTPVIPESPLAILLPLMMVAIIGGAAFISRRRNQVSVS